MQGLDSGWRLFGVPSFFRLSFFLFAFSLDFILHSWFPFPSLIRLIPTNREGSYPAPTPLPTQIPILI